MKLKFRAADPGDCEALVELVNSAYRGESSRQGWTTESHLLDGLRTDREMLLGLLGRPGHDTLLAYDEDGVLVASVNLERRSPQICYLGMFSVRPTYQAKGVGRLLLEHAQKFAKEHYGSSVIEMSVITVRTELIAWYERRGYRRTGRIIPFPVDPKFGVLKVPHLEMEMLEKSLHEISNLDEMFSANN